MTQSDTIERHLDAHEKAFAAHREHLASVCGTIAQTILDAFAQGGKLLICGNGGSAADAQHFAAELVNRYKTNRQALPAIALTTDSSALTSIGNDFSYEDVFLRQTQALGKPGDVLVGITTSGNSENVCRALRWAAGNGVYTVGLLGRDGGIAKSLCQEAIVIGTEQTGTIQELHITAIHIICDLIDQAYPSES